MMKHTQQIDIPSPNIPKESGFKLLRKHGRSPRALLWNLLVVGPILIAAIPASVSAADIYWDPDHTQLSNNVDGSNL